MKSIYCTVILIVMVIGYTDAQELEFRKIAFDVVDNLTQKNDSVIDREAIPSWLPNSPHESSKSKVEKDATEYYDYRWYNEFADSIVTAWVDTMEIKDNSKSTMNFALIGDGEGHYSIKKVTAITGYFFAEACGGYQIDRRVVVQNKSVKELICLFSEEVELFQRKIDLSWITSKDYQHRSRYLNPSDLLDKNQEVSFYYQKRKYGFIYSSSLSKGGISQKGFGTIEPTYFNNSLELVDDLGRRKVLMKNPYNFPYDLCKIGYGDIDGDKGMDILYVMSSEWCDQLVVMLSSMSAEGMPEYVGYAQKCVDP